jgi:hypothetical protein
MLDHRARDAHARTEDEALSDAVPPRLRLGESPGTHVANPGDTIREEESQRRATEHSDVRVQVPEPGNEVLAPRIDDLGAVRNSDVSRCPDRDDAIAGDEHRLIGTRWSARDVDDRYASKGD